MTPFQTQEKKENQLKSYSAAMKTGFPQPEQKINSQKAKNIQLSSANKTVTHREQRSVVKEKSCKEKNKQDEEERNEETTNAWKIPNKKGKKKHHNKRTAFHEEDNPDISKEENHENMSQSTTPLLEISQNSLKDNNNKKEKISPCINEELYISDKIST